MTQNYIERYWRDATPADAIKEPPMMARFRDKDTDRWLRPGHLVGWSRHSALCWHNNAFFWRYCQVYDAPDPGEGWRLIDPEKDDYNQNGVEYWNRGAKLWLPRDQGHDMTSFCSGAFYRIRIEPPKPKYVPFAWEDREQLRGRWITREKDGYVIEEIAYRFDSREFEVVAKDLLQDWHFVDTGEPVGKRIDQ